MQVPAKIRNWLQIPLLAEGLALLGAIIYAVQTWTYAHTQFSVLDEGSYLVKGYFFATGKYAPFADYGPWTNHMPLSFLLPGWAQVLFGPGLRAGRYLSVVCGLLMMVGLWLLVRRVAGRWWAVVAVGAIALSPALVKIYSQAISQVLVVCLLVWVLHFGLGKDRTRGQLVVSGVLAGALWLTRLNMFPVYFFLVAYVWWQHDRRAALQTALAGGAVVLLGHILLWPDILRIWVYWYPFDPPAFLQHWAQPADAPPSWVSGVDLGGRINSLLQALRFNFFPIMAVPAAWLLWPRRADWQSDAKFKDAVFLSALFALLFAIHAYATILTDHCVYCLTAYLTFFNVLGIVLFGVMFGSWVVEARGLRRGLAAIFVLVSAAAMGYAASDVFTAAFLSHRGVRRILFYEGALLPWDAAVWVVIENKFNLTYEQSFNLLWNGLRFLAPALIGLLLAALTLWLAQRLQKKFRYNVLAGTLVLFLAASFGLTPFGVLGGGYTGYDCGGDVLTSYEEIGARLAETIPAGSHVYWNGGHSAVPMLYMPDVIFYPAQINGTYTYRLGGDPDETVRYGFWNETLKQQWLAEADYVLVEERFFDQLTLSPDVWREIGKTPPLLVCRDNSEIYIFERISQADK
ncbi:MAG: glycosyltransferase family 39 protein [Anaerolineales bacterium]|nr:glycosyltransferase family 39 protein [Anaerolineales bacterium]